MSHLDIIIVNWNTCALLRNCLAALRLAENPAWRTWVVDNASTDDSVAMVRAEFPEVQVQVNTVNVGFARANNQALQATSSEYALLLNSDTCAEPEALHTLLAFMDTHPQAGAVSPQLRRPDGTPQPFAFGGDPRLSYLLRRAAMRLLFRRYLHNWDNPRTQAVDWVSGACLLVRRAAYAHVGGLDEAFFMYFEDADWCLRLRQAGWQVYYHPAAHILHIGGQSLKRNPRAQQAYAASLRYFYRKHYSPVAQSLLNVLLPLYARFTA